jgi:hypothetical protein
VKWIGTDYARDHEAISALMIEMLPRDSQSHLLCIFLSYRCAIGANLIEIIDTRGIMDGRDT